MLVGRLYGERKERAHLHWVFVNRGERYLPAKIRKVIWGGLAEEGKELGISDIRHFFAEMVRSVSRFSIEMKNEYIEELEDTGHAQAGHSTEISDRHYGRSPMDFIGLGKRSVERSRKFCVEWHKCLFFWEDGRKVIRRRKESPISSTRDAVTNQQSARSVDDMKLLLRNVKAEIREVLKRSFNEKDGVSVVQDGDSGQAKKKKVTGRDEDILNVLIPKHRDRTKDATTLIPPLRVMLKDPRAFFKSTIQADVTASVLEASEDILVLMGTGAGKSLCVLLPAFKEGKSFSTVVITPLAALALQWKKKCQDLEITAASWRERKHERVQVYIFAAEHVDNCEYREFIRVLSSQGLLKRIVFDEAHSTITWDDFRPSMSKARFMLGCVNRPVQRVLLSATVPPFERRNLLIACGMREAYLFRAPTARKNLSFFVHYVGGSAVGDGVGALLQSLSCSLKAEMKSLAGLSETIRIMIFVMRINDVSAVRSVIERFVKQQYNGVVLSYHGSMEQEKRSQAQKEWDSNDREPFKVMVCTSALGAGVDTRNLRLLIHFGGCSSLVQYAQECGRAGRNGELSKCVFLWNEKFARKQDIIRSKSISSANLISEKEYEERKYLWWNDVRRWVEERWNCRRETLFTYLDGEEVAPCIYEPNCNPCDVCQKLQLLTSEDLATSDSCRPSAMETIPLEFVTPVNKRNQDEVRDKTDDCLDSPNEKIMDSEELKENAGMKPGATMVKNHNEDRITRQETLNTVSRFEAVCRRIDGICLLCVVLHGRETTSEGGDLCESCKGITNRCFKCLSTEHKVGECYLPRFVKNHCNRCGLNKIDGKSAHQGIGFAKECPRPHLNHVFWLLWSKTETREQMFDELFTTNQRSAICDLVARRGLYAESTVQNVQSWLHNKTGLPTHVRVLSWWGGNMFNL